MGILTPAIVPGLKRHSRKACTAASSRISLPVLGTISQETTLPVARSILSTATPRPVMRRNQASYGYAGRTADTRSAITAPASTFGLPFSPAACPLFIQSDVERRTARRRRMVQSSQIGLFCQPNHGPDFVPTLLKDQSPYSRSHETQNILFRHPNLR